MKQNFVTNPFWLTLATIIQFGFLGPYLISAPSTVAVLIGVALFVVWAWWLKNVITYFCSKKES